MKTKIIFCIFLIVIAGCQEHRQKYATNTLEVASVSTDTTKTTFRVYPDPQWQESESAIEEMFNVSIGKYSQPEDTLIRTLNGKQRTLRFNRAHYGDINICVVEDSLSPIGGEFNSGFILVNRFSIRIAYNSVEEIIKASNVTFPKINLTRFANALIQQEYWHSKGYTGDSWEFYSDVVSIKVAHEYFLCQALLNTVSFKNGANTPETYGTLFKTYLSLLSELGVQADELKTKKNENFGQCLVRVLKKHPTLLTELNDTIIARY